jgi:hypothetical protein
MRGTSIMDKILKEYERTIEVLLLERDMLVADNRRKDLLIERAADYIIALRAEKIKIKPSIN